MERNIYTFLSSAKQVLFALVMTVLSGVLYAQTTYTFNYTGASQSVAIPAGNYSITCWGANGGDGGGTSATPGSGGKGGFSTGTYSTASNTTLYIYVGGQGQSTNSTVATSITAPGGWNGGGGGYTGSYNASFLFKGGGGGGSDVRTTQNTTYANRVIVAGGGGGGGGAGSSGYIGFGGAGGGTSGQDGVLGSSQVNHNGKGGTQTGGGTGGVYGSSTGYAGTFGVGGDGGSISGNYFPAGGGGGGWYGGGGGATQGGSGGGGSGYIGGVFSGTTIMFGQTGFVANPVTTGNGLVLIKELCSVTMSVNGVASNTTICSGNTLTLTTNAVNNYSWSNGASTSSIVVTPTSTTVYSLTALSPSNCTSSAILTITVHQSVPSLTVVNTASSTSGLYPGKTATITAFGATTYSWTGGITNGQSISVTGTNTYVVTGQNACGTSTAATSLSVHPSPTITATRSTASVCTTQSAVITGGGGTGNYTIFATSMAVQHGVPFYPFSSQNFTVIGQNALTCTASAQTNIQVVTTPAVPPVSTHSLICIGGTFTLTGVGASSYSWFPVPSTVVATNATIALSPTVTSTYTLTKSNANCVDTQSITVIVNQLPTVFAITNPATVCAGTNATLMAGGGVSYSWSPGTLPSGTGAASILVSPQQATNYTLTASDGTCINTSTVSVGTFSNPSFTIAMTSTNICSGQSVNYNINAGGNYSYTFANQPLSSPNLTNTSGAVTLTTTTNFMVTAGDNNNCVANRQQVVLVNPLPIISISANPNLNCADYPSTLTASSATVLAHSYQWGHGGGGVTSVVSPSVPTTYTVTGTNSITSCVNTQTVMQNVFLPTFNTIKDTAICNKGSVNLTASGALSYTWTGGPKAPFYNVSPSVTTIYTVSATSQTINGLKCVSSKTVEVRIYENPTVTATSQRSLVCRGESVQLYGNGANTYYWPGLNQTGSTITVNNIQAQLTTSIIGTDVFGCKDTNVVTVKFSNCPGFAEYNSGNIGLSVFPNPNNGNFIIKSQTEIALSLINELGQVIQEVSLNAQNNHQASVNNLAAGIYFVAGKNADGMINKKVVIQR